MAREHQNLTLIIHADNIHICESYCTVNLFDFVELRFTPVLTNNGFSPHEPQRIKLISPVNHKVPGVANNWG